MFRLIGVYILPLMITLSLAVVYIGRPAHVKKRKARNEKRLREMNLEILAVGGTKLTELPAGPYQRNKTKRLHAAKVKANEDRNYRLKIERIAEDFDLPNPTMDKFEAAVRDELNRQAAEEKRKEHEHKAMLDVLAREVKKSEAGPLPKAIEKAVESIKIGDWMGEFDPSIWYKRGDIVSWDGRTYIMRAASIGIDFVEGSFPNPNSKYWSEIIDAYGNLISKSTVQIASMISTSPTQIDDIRGLQEKQDMDIEGEIAMLSTYVVAADDVPVAKYQYPW